ncbi:MAG: hypothetical protein HY433_01890 [Candidatus Liptonbacteria bacterium]|nr:hypothetical protein [Candidatus Liptonbacteria bacterium]
MTARIKFFIVIAVLGAAAIGYFLLQTPSQPQPQSPEEGIGVQTPSSSYDDSQTNPQTASSSVSAPQQPTPTENTSVKPNIVTVAYTDLGFSPASVSIRKGETVKFVNQSPEPMWVASGVHPTHEVYGGTTLAQHCPDAENLTFDECNGAPSGQSWIFTFTKSGSWGYHNHLRARDKGTVTVE